ncbi:hypothetical protein GCM10010172_32790 [Paractinoplanes ferrugineus]|uniref:Uncharacterized protein n=1 Tax=Paractinoplanes ferrugineus TaxID=113564 RepID=A0A919MJJ3_9ACTN|nr:hypothetical protein [Actinoplanes ferrugineus]GIE14790.1 hypothetical protein Afe05nite_66300 [Actinoplanes ferrugineus]
MGDQQPEEIQPAAELSEPTRIEGGEEPSTVDAPARWSGSAAVPPPTPKKPRWTRRQPEPEDERAAIPAVDPWAGHDTPWDPFPAVDAVPLEDLPRAVDTLRDVPEIPGIDRTKPDPFVPLPATRIEPPPAAAAAPGAPRPPGTPPPTAPPAQRPTAPDKLSRRERKAREQAGRAAQAAAARAVATQAAATQAAAAQAAAAQAAAAQAAARAAAARNGRPPAVNRLPVRDRLPARDRQPARDRPGTPALPPAPPWAARPPQRPMPPPRRKRRWGRRLAVLTVLGVLCCCGGPFAYLQFPAARQYPVSAALPASFSDLQLRDDNDSRAAADRLAEQLRSAKASDGTPFAGVYGDSRGKRITLFGVTGWRFTPKSDVRVQLDNLTDQLKLKQVQSFDLGESGAHESCGVGKVDGNSVVVCAWADHGSLATVLLTRRSVGDSAELVSRLRNAVLSPG